MVSAAPPSRRSNVRVGQALEVACNDETSHLLRLWACLAQVQHAGAPLPSLTLATRPRLVQHDAEQAAAMQQHRLSAVQLNLMCGYKLRARAGKG